MGKISARISLPLLAILFLTASCEDKGDLMPISSSSEEAIEVYKQAVTCMDHAKLQPSWEGLSKAIELDPDLFMAHFWMYFVSANDCSSASGPAFRSDMNLNKGELELQKALKYLVEGERDLTQVHLKKAVELYPRDPQMHKILYTVQLQIFHEDDAGEKSIQRTIKMCPDYAPVYNLQGYLYMDQGNLEGAEKAFDKYIELAPEQANPYDSKGDFYMAGEDYQKAYESYMKAWEMDNYFELSRKKAEKAKKMMAWAGEKDEQ